MLAYYHKENHISLGHFDQTVLKEYCLFFYLDYIIIMEGEDVTNKFRDHLLLLVLPTFFPCCVIFGIPQHQLDIFIRSHIGSNITQAVVVVIVWYMDLQLKKQSVPITTEIVSSNPAHGEMYLKQHYVIMLSVTCDMSVVSFLAFRFPPPIKLTTTI